MTLREGVRDNARITRSGNRGAGGWISGHERRPKRRTATASIGRGRVQNLFGTMVYHTDRARRLAPNSPLLLPERVPVMIVKDSIRLFDPPSCGGFFYVWRDKSGPNPCMLHFRIYCASSSGAASSVALGISQL